MITIGVSIAVPDPEGRALQEYRVGLGDLSARQIPTHITLVPPFELPEDALPEVVRHLGEVAAHHGPFQVSLRGTGTFRPVSPVVFLGVDQGAVGCRTLAASVRQGPLAVSVEFPYHPHVTVAHHLDDGLLDRAFAELAGYETDFEVVEFWLYTHAADQGWRPQTAFPLGGGGLD